MRCRRAAAAIIIAFIIAITFLTSRFWRSRQWRYFVWLLSSRISRKIFGGPPPLLCITPQSELIPNTYTVSLWSGYSLEQHKQTIGRGDDLERAIHDFIVIADPLFGNLTDYHVEFDDPTLMAAVQSDYGVWFLECRAIPHPRLRFVGGS